MDRYQSPGSTVRQQINTAAIELGYLSNPKDVLGFSEYLHSLKSIPHRHRDIHLLSQVTYGLFDLIEYSFLGAFERITQDLEEVSQRIWGKSPRDFGFQSPSRTNAASKLHDAYTDADLAMVNGIYDRDFEAFGYPMLTKTEDLSNPDALMRDTSVKPLPQAQPAG